jgi:uncharacterized protein (DUF1499 family)
MHATMALVQTSRPRPQPFADNRMKNTRLPLSPLLLALLALLLLSLSGIGVRAGVWPYTAGFQLLRWAVYVGVAAAAVAVIFLIVPRLRAVAPRAKLMAIVLGLGVAYVPWHMLQQAKALPPIHDISTDLTDPPVFEAVLPLRANATNPAVYGGAALATAQRQGYPDIQPLRLPFSAAQAWTRALAVARAMGWEIVAADANRGRIEATDTTRWFGFKDDIVVRVVPADSGCRIDVRSVSRVGKSDAGTNAKRIRAYLAALQAG